MMQDVAMLTVDQSTSHPLDASVPLAVLVAQ